jgi:hypothetical protein
MRQAYVMKANVQNLHGSKLDSDGGSFFNADQHPLAGIGYTCTFDSIPMPISILTQSSLSSVAF